MSFSKTLLTGLLMVGFLATSVFVVSCSPPPPVNVGFVGGLTGRLSDLGLAGRRGVELAVEKYNKAGGIKGRLINLVVKDDGQDATLAVKVDQALIDEGVVAILGHMTSAMAIIALPIIDKAGVVMLSPTASSDLLGGKPDYFFRVVPAAHWEIVQLATYARQKLKLQKIGLVFDLSNAAFSDKWRSEFITEFSRLGGSITGEISYTNGPTVAYGAIAKEMSALSADGYLFISGALDTAMLAQQLRKTGNTKVFLSTGWANAVDLVKSGGTAVEGIIFAQARNVAGVKSEYLQFKEHYKTVYGVEPDVASIYAYEAASVIFQAMEQSMDRDGLGKALLSGTKYRGLQTEISFDSNGDALQDQFFFMTVKNGKFEAIP